MRIEAIDVSGFGCLRACRLRLDDGRANVILAPNEAGKSTLLSAVETALYGFPPRRTGEGREMRLRHRAWSGGASRVGLELRGPVHLYRIEYDICDAHGRETERFTVFRDGQDVTDEMQAQADTPGEWLLGLGRDDFRRSLLVRQGELDAVADDLSEMVRHLEQVVTSAEAGHSAAAAVARLETALNDYRSLAGLDEWSSTHLARARHWVQVETRLEQEIEARRRERAQIESRREALAGQIAALESSSALVDALERGAQCLGRLELAAAVRQLGEGLERDDRVRGRLAEIEAELEAHRDVAGFAPEIAEACPALREREAQHRHQLEEAADVAAVSRARLDTADAELADLDDVRPLVADLDERRADLRRWRELAGQCRESTAAVDAARKRLADQGVSLSHLEAARARYEQLGPAERDLVVHFERRCLEVEKQERESLEAARSAQEIASDVVDRRRRRRRLGVIVAMAGVVLGIALAALLQRGAGASPALALVAGLGLVVAALLPAVWLLLTGRTLDTAAYDAAQRDEAAAAKAAETAQRARVALGTDIEAVAGRIGIDPEELRRDAALYLERRDELLEHDHLQGKLAERSDEMRRRQETWRASLAVAARSRPPEEVTLPQAEALLERVQQRVGAERRAAEARSRLDQDGRAAARAREQLLESQEEVRDLLERAGIEVAASGRGEPLAPAALQGAFEKLDAMIARARRREALERERGVLAAQAMAEAGRERIVQRLEALRGQLEEAGGGAEEALERVRRLDHGLPDLAFDHWSLESLLPEETSQARARLQERAADVRREMGAACRDAREFLDDYARRLPQLEREELRLAGELRRGRHFEEAIGLARDRLQSVQMDSYERWRDVMLEHLDPLVSGLLSGYRLAAIHRNLSIELVHEASGRRLTLEEISRHFSRGARDRFFLAMRVALSQALGSGGERRLPLLLDDPLANCDDANFAAGMGVFADLAAAGTPLVLFSCQRSRCHEALGADPRVRELVALHEFAAALGEAADGALLATR